MLFLSALSFSTALRRALLLLVVAGAAGPALAQCPYSYCVDDNSKKADYTLSAGQTLYIAGNVKYAGTITVVGSNAAIFNAGEIAGAVTVNSGLSGTALTNLGQVSSQNIKVNSPATITNGTATALNTGITWSGAVGTNFTTGQTINNYAGWSAQVDALPSSTINNFATGTWSAYLVPTGTSLINNAGAWSAANLNYAGSLTINHTGGTWTANLNPGSALAINNSGTWTKGFNYPTAGPNSFTNSAGASATFDAYFGTGSKTTITTITNNGSMSLGSGMGDLTAGSQLANNRGATFQVTGQFVSAGTVSNAGTMKVVGNFTNSAGGVITGPAAPQRGSITASGYTQNAGTFGSTGQLDFCSTANRPAAGFDSQTGTGTVGRSTTFCSAYPLPVVLVSFTAAPVKNFVQLRWATASEKNTAYFVVERSADGRRFESLSTTKGQGTSTTLTEYQATDGQPLAGQSYYRLRQVDADGTTSYSPVSAVNLETRLISFTLTPNPTSDEVLITLAAGPAQPGTGDVFSLNGQLMLSQSWEGGGAVPLDVRTLPAGVYLLRIRTAGQQTMHRLLKL